MNSKRSKNNRYNKVILVPTDFSPVCDNAIAYGVELAQILDYHLCILHVIDKKKDVLPESQLLNLQQIEEKLDRYRSEYATLLPEKIETLALEGQVFKRIGEVATEKKANLMILGTHGKQGLQHLFGSHALKVVLDSPCPVVVVQKRGMGEGFKKIILPISSDIEPRQAVDWVLLMSHLFQSQIMIFQSLEYDEPLNTRLKQITKQITTIFDEKAVNYTIQVAEKQSDFSTQVIAHAAANMAHLIMIMTMPAVDLTGFSFSAWDERIMFNEAQIPVMCINPIDLGDYYYEWMK